MAKRAGSPQASGNQTAGVPRKLRVCYFGTYRQEYARNRLNMDRLRSNGVEVIECHATLWRGFEDREQIAGGGWRQPGFLWRAVTAYLRLLWRYRKVGHYDILMIGYPGQPDMPLARLLSWLRRKPLVWDLMMSIYLIAAERKIDQRSPFTLRMIRGIEKLACQLPNRIIVDTPEYSRWYQENYAIPAKKIRLLPLGADDRIFHPQPEQAEHTEGLHCLYYGTFIPNHGVRYIIEAARILAEHPAIHFTLVGTGPQRDEMETLARSYHLANIAFLDWMDETSLVKCITNADLLLGTFGVTPQALMTMQHKIHESLAMAKPVINGDSPVMRSVLEHGKHIYLVPREDGQALAEAILTLQQDPFLRQEIAAQGHAFYQENLSMRQLGKTLTGYLEEIARGGK